MKNTLAREYIRHAEEMEANADRDEENAATRDGSYGEYLHIRAKHWRNLARDSRERAKELE